MEPVLGFKKAKLTNYSREKIKENFKKANSSGSKFVF